MKLRIILGGIFVLFVFATSCDTNPPSVVITSPANGAEVSIYDTVLISAEMDDPDGDLYRTEIYINDVAQEHSFTNNISFQWSTYYDTIGPRTITVTAVDNKENEYSAEVSVTVVSSVPKIDFMGDPDTVSVNKSVQFTDLSAENYHYADTAWAWDFGAMGTSTEQNPKISFTSKGVYDITLTVYNEFGSNALTKTGYIVVE